MLSPGAGGLVGLELIGLQLCQFKKTQLNNKTPPTPPKKTKTKTPPKN